MNYRPTVSNLEFHLHVTRSMYFNLLCQEFNTLFLCNAFLIFSICSNTTSLCHISKMPTLCSTCSKLKFHIKEIKSSIQTTDIIFNKSVILNNDVQK